MRKPIPYIITDIHRGTGARKQFTYACVTNTETGERVISADVAYCAKWVERKALESADQEDFGGLNVPTETAARSG